MDISIFNVNQIFHKYVHTIYGNYRLNWIISLHSLGGPDSSATLQIVWSMYNWKYVANISDAAIFGQAHFRWLACGDCRIWIYFQKLSEIQKISWISNVKMSNLFRKDMKCRNRGQVFTILPLSSIIAVQIHGDNQIFKNPCCQPPNRVLLLLLPQLILLLLLLFLFSPIQYTKNSLIWIFGFINFVIWQF